MAVGGGSRSAIIVFFGGAHRRNAGQTLIGYGAFEAACLKRESFDRRVHSRDRATQRRRRAAVAGPRNPGDREPAAGTAIQVKCNTVARFSGLVTKIWSVPGGCTIFAHGKNKFPRHQGKVYE